jgi:pSer/pThr/pTyr-binding forkhead associated (FHA) protein
MRVKLVLLTDQGERTIYRVKKLPAVIGRGRDADMTLAHPLASRHHCELYDVDGTLCVRDLGSLNGTFVGDFRVTEAALESGDLLIVGGAKFEVVIEPDAAGPLMPPADTEKPFEAKGAEAEPAEQAVEDISELEPVEDSLSDIDFTEAEPPAPAPAPAQGPAAAAPPSKRPAPAKSAAPAKEDPKKPQPQAPTPKGKTPTAPQKPAAKEAAAESAIDFAAFGTEGSDAPSGDDSGLNSFLKKL